MDAYIDRTYYASAGHVDNVYYYFRIVRRQDGWIWNNNTLQFEIDTSWANSAISITEKDTTGAFPIIIPASFPSTTVDIVVYRRAGSSPANTDDVSDQYQTKIGSIFGF